eukprot:6230883-Amphidinium_carterae.1
MCPSCNVITEIACGLSHVPAYANLSASSSKNLDMHESILCCSVKYHGLNHASHSVSCMVANLHIAPLPLEWWNPFTALLLIGDKFECPLVQTSGKRKKYLLGKSI